MHSHLNAEVQVQDRVDSPSEERDLVFEIGGRYILRISRDTDFLEEERIVAEIAACLCTVLLRQRDNAATEEKKRRAGAVRTVINSLSYSELDAATYMVKTFAQNDKTEGIIVAGNIADTLGFTRSVVTGTLRKLEGASLIETRSLGMKGTYIKIKDTLLIAELSKL